MVGGILRDFGCEDQPRLTFYRRRLLQQIERESLKERQLQEVRHYVQRHWNVPARRLPLAVH